MKIKYTDKRLTMRFVFIIDFKIRFNEYPIVFMWLPGFGEPALFSLYSAFGAMWVLGGFFVFSLCLYIAFYFIVFSSTVVQLFIHLIF